MSIGTKEEAIYGAKAYVAIQFVGTFDQLATKLADALNLKEITIETNEEPPHQRIASAETMGWELWLEEDTNNPLHNFRLRIETEHAMKESFLGRMHDLSPWYARLVASQCDVKAQPLA